MSLLQRLLNYRPNSASRECMSDQDIISEGMGHTWALYFDSSLYLDTTVLVLLAWTPLLSPWLTSFGRFPVVRTSNNAFTPNWIW